MDELNLIRTLLSEAPPSAEVIAEGRRRIAGQSTRRRRAPVRWGLTGAGLAAAAAAAAAITLAATASAEAAPRRISRARRRPSGFRPAICPAAAALRSSHHFRRCPA